MGFIAYDPRVKDERHQMFLAKFEPAAEEIAAVERAAQKFLAEVEQMWEILTSCIT